MGLYGFIFKKLNKNIKEEKNPGVRWGIAHEIAQAIQPIYT